MRTNEERIGVVLFVLFIGFVLVALVSIPMYVIPRYNVWSQGLKGQSELARAEYERQVQVKDAEGRRDAAKMLSDAEIERARGVAEANKIIGESLKNNEAYLRYLWVNGLNDRSSPTVVYVPTEAGMPVLEAGRLLTK